MLDLKAILWYKITTINLIIQFTVNYSYLEGKGNFIHNNKTDSEGNSPILSCPTVLCRIMAMKWTLLYPVGLGQLSESPWSKGANVPSLRVQSYSQ